jgi:hemin uptake protein HemP
MNTVADQDDRSNIPAAASAAAASRSITLADHRIDSRDLFVGTREITIAHGTDLYRLRLTAQNKLILTK